MIACFVFGMAMIAVLQSEYMCKWSYNSSQDKSVYNFQHFGQAVLHYRNQKSNLIEDYQAGMRLIATAKLTPHPFWMVIPGNGSHVAATNVNLQLLAEGKIKDFILEDNLATAVYRRYCKSPTQNLVIDIGSNIGWYSALAIAHGCRAITVDGANDALLYYQATVAMNGWHQAAKIVNHVVTDQMEGTFVFNGWNTFNKEASTSWVQKDNVAINSQIPVRMDSLVARDIVAYLKVDIEGHEPDGFSSGKSLFKIGTHQVLNVLFEFTYRLFGKNLHSQYKQKVFDMLWNAGYTCYSLTNPMQQIQGWEEFSSSLESNCGNSQHCGLNIWCTISDMDIFDLLYTTVKQ